MVRSLLCEAANVLLARVHCWSWLKRWSVEVARQRKTAERTVEATRQRIGDLLKALQPSRMRQLLPRRRICFKINQPRF